MFFGKVAVKMLHLITAVLILAVNPESDAATADLARFPSHEQHLYAYLTTSTVAEAERQNLVDCLKFVVPSLSAKVYLEDQIPQPVEGTALLRLNLAGLGWESTYWREVAKVYPYRPDLRGHHSAPLVVDGLWFAANALDSTETADLQYQLLYGGKPPKTADEFLKFWGIQNDPEYLFGVIEAKSGVALELVRLIENRPGSKRNYSWLTRDSRKVAGKSDPLENLPNNLTFDAQEIIVGSPKWKGGKSGMLQAYLLADGQGKRQEKAPADIVEDHARTRGGAEIRNSSGCIACHAAGINPPTVDAFRQYIISGARVGFYKKQDQQNVDRYLGSDVAKEIKLNQAAYEDGVALVNGLTGQENAANYQRIVRVYDAPVDLAQAAREVYTENAKELQLALADYSRRYPDLTARLSALAQGKYRLPNGKIETSRISRHQWQENFERAQLALEIWRKR